MESSSQRRQKHVTTACMPCRKAKAKCDGELPCQTCNNKSRDCQYDSQQDLRTVGKRAYDELSTRSEMLDTIINSLRTSDPKSSEELLEVIRGGATADEIAQCASEIGRRGEKSSKRTRQNVMAIISLVDQPLVRVPAQPWTQVIDDDDAVSHLLSAYLAWQYSTYPVFDPDIVVREMNSKQLSSPYCSRFLVSSLLTLGCMYTDHPAAFAEPGDMSSRGVHFFREANRLWELEEGRVALTNLQGLVILITCVTIMGKDRLALLYGSQLSPLCLDLETKIRRGRKLSLDEYTSQDFQRSYSHAAWGSFNLEVELCMAWRTPFSLHKPRVARPYSQKDLTARDQWRPYPKPDLEIEYCPNMVNNAGFSLYMIGAEICAVLLSGNPQDSPLPGHAILEPSERLARAQTIEQNLLAWYDNLPLQPTAIETSTTPHMSGPMVGVQLTYHVWRITINSIVFHEVNAPQAERDIAGEKIVSACKRIANILQYAQSSFGILSFPCYTTHAASVGAHNLVQFLSRPDIPDIFHVMIVGLTATCYRWTIARGIIRTLWITIKERKLEEHLLATTISLLKLNAVESWGPEDHRLFISCTYPNYATSSDNGRDLTGVGELLASYARLDVNEEDEQKGL